MLFTLSVKRSVLFRSSRTLFRVIRIRTRWEAFLISAATIGMLVLPVGVVPAVPLYLTARYADLRRDASGIFFSTLCGIIVHLFFLMILMAIMYFIAVLWAIPFPKDLLLECAISAAYASPVALVCSLMVSFALPRPD